jgi:excisionase family DNA binding protein
VPEQTTNGESLEDLTSKLISVTRASEISGLTTSYIRRLLREGRIEGVKIGRNWLTTEETIREYLKQERRPGPKPKEK